AIERGLTRVPGDQLRLVLPAARARQPVDEDVVDRAFPVDLHRRLLRSSILATWVAVSTKAARRRRPHPRSRAYPPDWPGISSTSTAIRRMFRWSPACNAWTACVHSHSASSSAVVFSMGSATTSDA